MPKRRIQSKEELLDFAIERYRYYNGIVNKSSDLVSHLHLYDFLADLVLIQNFASKQDEISKERTEGMADLS